MKKIIESLNKNSVYYDGQCPVCSREINQMKNAQSTLNFEDIHQQSTLNTADRSTLLKQLHLVTASGELLTGFEANVYLWRSGNLSWLARLVTLPLIQPVAKAVYDYWAAKRYKTKYAVGSNSQRGN